ncbi:MAG TPA: polysaccharide deacetylase family protein [Solirubrobacteraceae bacterium]|jgi:peptidoglycan/xylan/chitin deacetylase (PgdA/CDA1 family)|nr:polysaccharide deacetylase family protein [Solirubrobacteraceae bacterium]
MDVEQRRARREARRREIARRRTRGLAAVALIAVLAVVAVVALGSGGGSSKGGSHGASVSSAGAGGSDGAGGSGGATSSQAGRRDSNAANGAGGKSGGSGAILASTGRPSSAGTAGTATGPPGHESVPILMYHVINPPPAGAKFPGLYVSPEEFSAQMHALAGAGFHAVTMDQMRANWTRGTPLPAGKPIVLSFDNGYQSQYTQALPVLRRLGWVGVENMQLTGLPPSQGGLSDAQIHGLVAAGWELDTQGISHADLITLGPAALHEQVAVARARVQRLYHVPVNWFCYPSGHYNAIVVAAVKAAGYVGSTTVVPGWASPSDDPYRLPRLRVLGGTSPESLLAELAAIRSNPAPPESYGGDE